MSKVDKVREQEFREQQVRVNSILADKIRELRERIERLEETNPSA